MTGPVLSAILFLSPKLSGAVELSVKVDSYSRMAGVDPLLVVALAYKESSFNRHAISKKRAVGLMQLRLVTAQFWATKHAYMNEVLEDNLRDADMNLQIGCWYLARLLREHQGGVHSAIKKYNGSKKFADSVVQLYEDLQRKFAKKVA